MILKVNLTFQELLIQYGGVQGQINPEIMKAGPLLPKEQNTSLQRQITMEEVKIAILSMGANKAFGPYGFTTAFYQHHWELVKSNVHQTILFCVQTKNIPKSMAATVIHLFPKSNHASTAGDYRPIAYCNVI